MPRPTVHTDPELRERARMYVERTKLVGALQPLAVEGREVVGALVARVEELEALARTPRFENDEDKRRYEHEFNTRCKRCGSAFVYARTDVRERTDQGLGLRSTRVTFVMCPCGAPFDLESSSRH